MKTWLERFEAARTRGGFTSDDVQAACSWLSCAVGEHSQQGTLIPVRWTPVGPLVDIGPYKTASGEYPTPTDGHLKDWGTRFYELVRDNMIDAAERLYFQIGDRVLELKRGGAETHDA